MKLNPKQMMSFLILLSSPAFASGYHGTCGTTVGGGSGCPASGSGYSGRNLGQDAAATEAYMRDKHRQSQEEERRRKEKQEAQAAQERDHQNRLREAREQREARRDRKYWKQVNREYKESGKALQKDQQLAKSYHEDYCEKSKHLQTRSFQRMAPEAYQKFEKRLENIRENCGNYPDDQYEMKRTVELIEDYEIHAEQVAQVSSSSPDPVYQNVQTSLLSQGYQLIGQSAHYFRSQYGREYRLLAETVLDLATSLTPGISQIRDAYEAFYGLDAITQRPLTLAERTLAVANLASFGMPKAGATIYKAIARVSEGVLKEKRIVTTTQKAVQQAQNLASSSSSTLNEATDFIQKWNRSQPGKAHSSQVLHDSQTLLKGTDRNTGFIPKEIGEKLEGREFRNWDHFRQEFWKTTSESKYAKEFTPDNLELMRRGNAPKTEISQALGENRSYQIHHMEPLVSGGPLYDMSNLAIVTPLYHQNILTKEAHRGK